MKHILTTLTALLLISLGMSAETRVTLHKAGTLASQLSQVQQDTITNLTIEGPINSADIRLLRRMAGYRESEGGPVGKLRTLDLRNARITSDKEPYLVLDATKEGLTVEGFHRMRGPFGHDYSFPTLDDNEMKYDITGSRLQKINDYYLARYVLGNVNHSHKSSVTTSSNGDVVVKIGAGSSSNMEKTLRKKKLKKLKGLKLKQKNGRYKLFCYPRKNEFIMSMFYNCPTLAALSIPSGADVCEEVVILHDPIRYYQFNKKGIKLKLE